MFFFQTQTCDDLLAIREKNGSYTVKQIGGEQTPQPHATICQFGLSKVPGQLSPDEEFVIVHSKQEVIIYSSRVGNELKRFSVSKYFKKLFFDSTNSLCFVLNKDIEVYETVAFTLVKKLPYNEGSDFQISTKRETLMISQVQLTPHMEQTPAILQVYDYNLGNIEMFELPPANEVQQLWNNTTLLLWFQRDGHSNQSYYGQQGLGLWDKQYKPLKVAYGPIHDVKWVANNFIVVAGYMPATCILYSYNGEPQWVLAQAHINQIHAYNNIVLLGGFGNLAGEIYIYDIKAMVKLGECKSEKTTLISWSPDGEYFLTATTLPRLRLDNKFQIFTKLGEKIYTQQFEELYEANWRTGATVQVVKQQQEENKVQKIFTLNTGVDFLKEMKTKIETQPKPVYEELFLEPPPKPTVEAPPKPVKTLTRRKDNT